VHYKGTQNDDMCVLCTKTCCVPLDVRAEIPSLPPDSVTARSHAILKILETFFMSSALDPCLEHTNPSVNSIPSLPQHSTLSCSIQKQEIILPMESRASPAPKLTITSSMSVSSTKKSTPTFLCPRPARLSSPTQSRTCSWNPR
jgi:hypothetical protein